MYAQAMVSNTESPIDRNHILNNGEPNFTQKIELHTKEKKVLINSKYVMKWTHVTITV